MFNAPQSLRYIQVHHRKYNFIISLMIGKSVRLEFIFSSYNSRHFSPGSFMQLTLYVYASIMKPQPSYISATFLQRASAGQERPELVHIYMHGVRPTIPTVPRRPSRPPALPLSSPRSCTSVPAADWRATMQRRISNGGSA